MLDAFYALKCQMLNLWFQMFTKCHKTVDNKTKRKHYFKIYSWNLNGKFENVWYLMCTEWYYPGIWNGGGGGVEWRGWWHIDKWDSSWRISILHRPYLIVTSVYLIVRTFRFPSVSASVCWWWHLVLILCCNVVVVKCQMMSST